ncbi:MAG: hypothetical protein HZB57_04805, partial [Gammaproteobacteria bacterium]|nr:hypothetical protein [Gammaproteobacteria bacterium]
MFKPLLMTFMLGATSIAQAQMYYVDASNGSDTWTGTAASCTGCDPATASSGPWRTVAKVNSSSFLPGDSVLFQCGGVWRETLEVPSSGTAATPISIGSYPAACPEGSSKPEITGSERITGWSSYTGNIYVATANVSIAP